jgi:hypothetical protein
MHTAVQQFSCLCRSHMMTDGSLVVLVVVVIVIEERNKFIFIYLVIEERVICTIKKSSLFVSGICTFVLLPDLMK